jgi:Arc/MetJ-type ribon-helix-helix transcriptional regulator
MAAATAHTDHLAGRKNVPVHLTPDYRDDLAVLMRNGRSATDAIRAAVRTMADAHRYAWESGDVAEDVDPDITAATYRGKRLPCGHTVGLAP